MRAPLVSFVASQALLLAVAGCTCSHKEQSVAPAPSGTVAAPAFELQLARSTLIAFGNSTPLPVSADFGEEVPELRPALERASKAHANEPLPMRIARDVPYGQLTRVMQAARAYRVTNWRLAAEDESGTVRSVVVQSPGPLPTVRCFARAWLSPDRSIHVAYDTTGNGTMHGVVARSTEKALAVVRRLDGSCTEGQLRLYTQPAATFGPLFDLALATVASPPKVSSLMLGVPSIGPLDLDEEVVP